MKAPLSVFLLIGLLVGLAPAVDSLNVRLIGFRHTSNMARGVDVGGNYACIADNYAGLRVIDVSDPTAPSEVGHYDNPGATVSLAVIATEYVYLPDSASGLHVITLADPANPTEVGFLSTPDIVGGMAVSGQYACAADGGEVLVVSVADPASPSIVATCDTSATAVSDVAISGGYAYAIDFFQGLEVISLATRRTPSKWGTAT
jgi:hypothetical protein